MRATPDWKEFMQKGAFKDSVMTGKECTDWVAQAAGLGVPVMPTDCASARRTRSSRSAGAFLVVLMIPFLAPLVLGDMAESDPGGRPQAARTCKHPFCAASVAPSSDAHA